MDEYDVIAAMKSLARLPRGYLPLGDDVAVLPTKRGRLVAKCDMLVAKTDVPPGMSWKMAARKAMAMCVSDFAAKGATPDSFMVSLGLPKNVKETQVRELVLGFRSGMDEWGVKLVGGDTSEAGDLVIDCVMFGFAERVVTRDGAKPGDLVVATGRFGEASAGLKILLDGAKADDGLRSRALERVYSPVPRLKLGLRLAGYLSSSIDSSDGLAICLHTLAEMSGIRVEVESLPVAKSIQEFANANQYDEDELALYGGEEYEIVGTIPESRLQEARAATRACEGELLVVGRTARGSGVVFADGKSIRKEGWVHLR